jgi:two-component system cell cycle sensor histidine kinase/response regulator CckA
MRPSGSDISTSDAAPIEPPSFSERPRKRTARMDALSGGVVVFFLIAVGSAAYAALQAGPAIAPALILLIGLAGVALVGVISFAQQEARPARAEDDASAYADALEEPAAVVSPDGRVLQSNGPWRTEFGASSRLLRGPLGGAVLYAALAEARRTGRSHAEFRIGDKTSIILAARLGEGRLLVRLAPVAAPTPRPPQVRQLAVPTPTAALDAFAAAAPFGAALVEGDDPFEGVVLEANAALVEMTDGAARPGVRFGDLLDPAGLEEVKLRLRGKRGPAEARLAVGARTVHLYVTAAEGRRVAFLLDVSEQKQLEIQLVQSQKMQAIGQLAGGVAHDFNNLLTAIQLRLDELLHRHPVGDPSYEGLNEIRQTAVRAADLVRKLLAFSRKQTVQRETLELGELISEFEVLLRRLLREDVKLVTDYGRNLPLVRADKSALETAVMNLAVNARDALRSHGAADGGVGVVRIRTARLTGPEALQLGYPEAPVAGAALIEVADNGPGIPPDVMTKIFEPFFTTKPVGEGTGLGLATVYGIVKQADGWIQVESHPGKGAAFRIFLPIFIPPAPAPGEAPFEARAAQKVKHAPRDLSGAGRILFVEDEDAVRVVAARLLRARGYEVIEAADGEEALQLAEENAGRIDLLISDVIMPGLDGPTLLKRARQFLGDAQVMFISGYAEAEFSDILEGEEGVTFLPKPIDIKVLAERVKVQLQAA